MCVARHFSCALYIRLAERERVTVKKAKCCSLVSALNSFSSHQRHIEHKKEHTAKITALKMLLDIFV